MSSQFCTAYLELEQSLGIRKLYWIRSAESVPGFGTKIHSVSRDQQLIGSTDLGLSGLDGKALEVSLPRKIDKIENPANLDCEVKEGTNHYLRCPKAVTDSLEGRSK
ncbi:unnamed protein product [Dovyalis caffra]|uniref:Ig-like domain-containing protein n=1 Tax=Dovyalis caffra TaxID=77055 RepID=A0AAV1QPN9_9ROSI|nr:unnamed protein product [Dovyalis caffra]CAK7324387.1 unnamed protein product [Dovyalis caffra]CAK7328636.1 unnamed protein product [Dovyalis caffra]